MKDKEYLNFMGDDGNYIFNPPMPNPYGLRGNPDNNANCQNNDCYQGDGLNGTPAHFDVNDRVYDYPPADFNSFDGSQWSNDGTEDTGWNNQTGKRSWFSRLLDSDGMSTYYTCTDGIVTSQQFETGKQPSGWGRNRNNACLSQSEIDDKRQNRSDIFGNILTNINQGLNTGLNVNKITSPNYNPNNTNTEGTAPLTTTTTESGIGTTGKIVGWVLVAGVVASLGFLAIKRK